MKIFALLFLIISCSTTRNFPNKKVCYLLYNLQTSRFEKEINPRYCKERLGAASTFKIPLAVMGFESGVLKNESTTFQWDGKKNFLDSWNKDQDVKGWLKESVVWYSQELVKKMGHHSVAGFVRKFEYGNMDTSGNPTSFWLPQSPLYEDREGASLKVSAYEQVEFMVKLWKNQLPVSLRSQELAKMVLPTETNPPHRELKGKTGSGFVDAEMRLRLGWYVAHLKSGFKEYIVVTNFTDSVEMPQPRNYGGVEAKEITKQLLVEDDLF